MYIARNCHIINGSNNLYADYGREQGEKRVTKALEGKRFAEFTAYANQPEPDEIEDTSNLVELENMDSVIQEAIEKSVK